MNHLNTFSILARDPQNGDMIVAGASCWFSYGTLVPYAAPGIGVVATQAECNIGFGPSGLALLKDNIEPKQALDQLINSDPNRTIRQLMILNNHGKSASYTGKDCTQATFEYCTDNLVIAGNTLKDESVITEMVKYYTTTNDNDFPLKVIHTLQIGQDAGGDMRGKKSAALISVNNKLSDQPWENINFDIRVDDSADPLKELLRLYNIAKSYKLMNQGDTLLFEDNKPDLAIKAYKQAYELNPDDENIIFWYSQMLEKQGHTEESLDLFKRLGSKNQLWTDYKARISRDNVQ
jgi:uncharacterized Ntn-hydrolase superfamily protein